MTVAGTWPNGKRIAVLLSVLLESWSEGKSPSYFPRTTPLRAGAVDHAGAQWASYGGKEGIWRLLSILARNGRGATVFANALAAERYPEAIRAVMRGGHDLAAHGYAQDQYLSDLTAERQQALIRRVLDALGASSGTRPLGWASSVYSWNEDTVDLLVREGVRWHVDVLDASSPSVQQTPSGSIVALPWCDFVDNRVLRASPRDYFDVYRDSFDFLHANEPMAVLHVAVHSHFGGRPLVAAQFEKLLGYFAQHPDVWFARHGELADWMVAEKRGDLGFAARFP